VISIWSLVDLPPSVSGIVLLMLPVSRSPVG
jgi:hypothetical protein